MADKQFQLVIPCFNEALSLTTLVAEFVRAALEFGHSPETVGIVIVENGSRDHSAEELRKICASSLGPWCQAVYLSENKGYGGGILSGLQQANAPVVGFMHADLQASPRAAFLAWDHLSRNSVAAAIVRGERHGRTQSERLVSRVFEKLTGWILHFHCHEINAQPKVFFRSLVESLRNPPLHFGFDLFVLLTAHRLGWLLLTIPVEQKSRFAGESSWKASPLSRWRTMLAMSRYLFSLRRAAT